MTNPTRRRRHPANGTRATALALSLTATGGLGFLLAASDGGTNVEPPTAPLTTTTTAQRATPTPTVAGETSTAPAPEPLPSSYVGEAVNTKWGPVQVEATVVAGQLVDVVAVQAPDGDRRSRQISESATPELRSAALEAQSAEIDTVSGATYTSDAYADSLQSAIDQAALEGDTVGRR